MQAGVASLPSKVAAVVSLSLVLVKGASGLDGGMTSEAEKLSLAGGLTKAMTSADGCGTGLRFLPTKVGSNVGVAGSVTTAVTSAVGAAGVAVAGVAVAVGTTVGLGYMLMSSALTHRK